MLCTQFQASFIKVNDSVDLPASFAGPLIATWLLAIPWPAELLSQFTSDEAAFKEMRTFLVAASGSASQKSSLLRTHISRALHSLSGSRAFLDDSEMASDADLLLPLLQRLKLDPVHPDWADLMALEEALLFRIDLCEIITVSPTSPGALDSHVGGLCI